MLQGIERLVSLVEPRGSALSGATVDQIESAVRGGDIETLRNTDGHFAAVARDGQTVRLARTIGIPLRYFVAKMFHGPFLIVADRIETLYDWCMDQKIGWQFDPLYTRMVPAHYLIEIDQIGCPDPAPRYHRFFDPPLETAPADIHIAGEAYVRSAFDALKSWIATLPPSEPIALAYSGGVDSASVLLLAHKALGELGRDQNLLRAFTLDLGNGTDATQARESLKRLGLEHLWEPIVVKGSRYDLDEAIRVIEDYHPLDVECAAAAICLLEAIRDKYPNIKYLLDGDGGDENLKSYPLEDSDLTISSILRNPLLYQEGWGVDAIKHSQTYSGGLSRSYMRTFAVGAKYGFEAFSPYTVRSVIANATALPFEKLLSGNIERLYSLKADVVSAGVKAVTGIDMPIFAKKRFQDGAGGDSYRNWKVSKAWCRQVFLKQWESRLKLAWDPEGERVSGNDLAAMISSR